jgi:hypothetical protein
LLVLGVGVLLQLDMDTTRDLGEQQMGDSGGLD